jgi:hypothetical protein
VETKCSGYMFGTKKDEVNEQFGILQYNEKVRVAQESSSDVL